MTEPVRIQRKRTKGWRMPEGAVYVGRPTRWGNPWRLDRAARPGGGWYVIGPGVKVAFPSQRDAAANAVARYRRWLTTPAGQPLGSGVDRAVILNGLADLRSLSLACWCPLDQPCHADVLLELANQETSDE